MGRLTLRGAIWALFSVLALVFLSRAASASLSGSSMERQGRGASAGRRDLSKRQTRTCDAIHAAYSSGTLMTYQDFQDWANWKCSTWYPGGIGTRTCDSIHASYVAGFTMVSQDYADWASWSCNTWFPGGIGSPAAAATTTRRLTTTTTARATTTGPATTTVRATTSTMSATVRTTSATRTTTVVAQTSTATTLPAVTSTQTTATSTALPTSTQTTVSSTAPPTSTQTTATSTALPTSTTSTQTTATSTAPPISTQTTATGTTVAPPTSSTTSQTTIKTAAPSTSSTTSQTATTSVAPSTFKTTQTKAVTSTSQTTALAPITTSTITKTTSTTALSGFPLNYITCTSGWSCTRQTRNLVVNGGSFDFSTQPMTSLSPYAMQADGGIGVIMLNAAGTGHEIFKLKNKVLWFTMDVSKVQCGYNAALYFSQMNVNAAPGTGYCDAQGTCMEFDAQEANVGGTSFASHSCVSTSGPPCDPWGCGAKSRLSDWGSVGVGKTIDTLKPITVATTFSTNDGTDTGTLTSITQTFFQGGKQYSFMVVNDGNCANSNPTYWSTTGRLPALSQAMDIGMTLILSFWGSGGASMSWLDLYPSNTDCLSASGSVNRAVWSNIAITSGPANAANLAKVQASFV
ncbi:glycoside hydrolase family 7 protein [Gonapodya prolifera JEL478]|uniref:cellulose 1,4-beta-cellobiosidase (non-reducing end) n=1 Tax=Gonapodya prolifera (strain JEL478) TaxID=1344416 RepID=A0A139AGT3_GONPJ|nr:glycoside hydrolase family 7 protein [Gonapodya prolifera JEL478]|eukprot:KXS15623.1 glycoside hydrolase family 7 protein [Gonapodya prolifera JEL478]